MITEDLVRLDADLGTDKHDVIRALARIVGDAGRATDVAQLADDALAREATAATGLNGGIAIPHCRSAGVETPTLAFARLSPAVDFGAKDGPADLAFLIAAPAGGDASHLKLLAKLARALVKKEFTDSLRDATTPAQVVELVSGVVGDEAPAAATSPPPSPAPSPEQPAAPAPAASTTGTTTGTTPGTTTGTTTGTRSLVAVTACPTGIAHTYMSADALQQAAAKAGVDIQVETQGSAGATPLPDDVIRDAGAVIFACDVGVRDRHRFAGLPMVSAGVKRAVDDADGMIADAVRAMDNPNAARVEGSGDSRDPAAGAAAGESWGARTRRILMTGVSYRIPFVAAGGLLIALGFLVGGYKITGPANSIIIDNTLFNLPDPSALELERSWGGIGAYLGAIFFSLGAAAFGFLVPALAGYIAYAIADRPGIAPGFIMGALAGILSTGFLGGIVGGVIAGLTAHWIAGWKVHPWFRGLMPVLVIPLLATLISGFVMIVVLGKPLAALMDALADGLNSMQGGSAIVLGVVLGLMMAFDMGGPLNKTAYVFATTGLATAAAATDDAPELKIMAAVMLAGMVPPLALALATVLRPQLFDLPERENGKAAWALGASFITEGAIPFAAADPARVIPAIMLGSAVTGGLSQAFDVTLRAPHGGIFVLFAVGNILGFLIALAAGVAVGCAAVILLKSIGQNEPATA